MDVIFNEPTATVTTGAPALLRRDVLGIITPNPYTILWKHNTATLASFQIVLGGTSIVVNSPAQPSGLYCSNVNATSVDALRFISVSAGTPVTFEGVDVYSGDRTSEFIGLGAVYIPSNDPIPLPDGGLLGAGQGTLQHAVGTGDAPFWLANTSIVLTPGTPGNCVLAQGASLPELKHSTNFGLWPPGMVYTYVWEVTASAGAAALYRVLTVNGNTTAFLPGTVGKFFMVTQPDESAAATMAVQLSNVGGNSLTINMFEAYEN
ncbi:unnamed protein product, partial [marine sediment metagenome]